MEKNCRLLLLFNVLFIFSQQATAQQKNIHGRVHTSTGVGISGASVQVKGAKQAAITDSLGFFTISAQQGQTLLISSIGFLGQEATASENADITLQDDNKQLTTVVVTAMGIKKEDRKIGYSVQAVNGADVTKAREANPIASLTGKVAGLSVGTSAEMLGRPTVVLRGNKDILYVVDGVPINSDSYNISPDDVDTYTILKGPNAAALYGFRGQNGAIVITTKHGTKAKKGWQVNLNSSQMIEKGFVAVPKPQTEYGRGTGFLYEYAKGSSYTYGTTGTDVLYDNTQRLPVWGPRFEGQQIKQYDSDYDPTTGVRSTSKYIARGKNNLDNFLQAGFLSTNNISAGSSGENYDIRMSYSHTYQKGMDPNTKLNIDNLNLNTSYKFTDKLTAEANLNFNQQYTPNIPDPAYGPNSYIYEFSVYGSADFDVRDLKNYYGGDQGQAGLMQLAPEYGRMNNPYFQAAKWLRGHYKTDVYGYLKLNYAFNKDLNLSLRSQVTTWNQTRTEDVPASANLNSYLSWYSFGTYYGDYRQDKRNLLENNTDALLTYNKRVSNFNINALAGGGFRSFKYNSEWSTTQNLNVPGVYSMQNSKGTAYSYTYLANMMVYSGYYGLDLTYGKYVTLSTTGRVDNLSTLSKGNRTFFYPSVSLSTVLSDYIHFPDVINSVKLRASYADVKSGLTQASIPSAYMMITGKTTNAGLLGYGDELYSSYDGPSYTNQMGISNVTYYNSTPSVSYSSTLANSNLKPADNKSYEAGLDVRLLDNRIGLNATYFVSLAGPQIYSLAVAASTGYAAKNVNGITTKKNGWELTLNASPLRNPHGLNWDVMINYATYKEVLKDIYGNESGLTLNGHIYRKGERMDDYYGTGFVRTLKGDIVYSGGVPMANPSSALDDAKFLGHMNPDFSFGINNRFSYKQFSFSFQFDGRIGGRIYDRVYYQMTNGGNSKESVSGALGAARLAEWKSTNTGANKPTPAYVGKGVVITGGTPIYSKGVVTNSDQLTLADNTTAVTVQSFLSSGISSNNEYYMVSRSYAKLREVTFGYSLPAAMLEHKYIKGLTVTLVGRNLLYFAQRKDFDIDQYSSGYNFSDNSLNGTSGTGLQSPTARRYGVNLNITF